MSNPPTQEEPTPTHPGLLKVVRCPGSFSSYSVATTTLPPGALMARLTSPPLTFAPAKRWSSVQVSETRHIELNCDFLYINHSCEPSLEFHIVYDSDEPVIDIVVATRRAEDGTTKIGIREGDELTFFYPSTEWEMDQPFQCKCATRSCKGVISGAKNMTSEQLRGYFVNAHIENLRSVPGGQEKTKEEDESSKGQR